MAGTVLGKRNRGTDSHTVSPSPSSISARVKRRTRVSIHSDGDATPTFAPDRRDGDEYSASRGLDALAQQRTSSSTARGLSRRDCSESPNKASRPVRVASVDQDEENDENNVQLPTPKTPRRRDALSKKIPITPRHRIGLVGKPITPRFSRTPSTPSNAPTVYNGARQLFTRGSDPGPLVGRSEEWNEVQQFIQQGIDSNRGRCLYVSGPPGTGKSALVGEVCRRVSQEDDVKVAYINCMSVKSSGEMGQKLAEAFLEDKDYLENHNLEALRAVFFSQISAARTTYVVTLDEIDRLLVLDLEILYTLFEWSLSQSSRLIVVGIANALDLTDRFLPRLKARHLKPQLLPFLPYTSNQIAEVITTKLCTLLTDEGKEQANFVPFLHPAAIQLCSKKVASQTGDLRKAFDIVRRAIDLIESETRTHQQNPGSSPSKTPLANNPNLSSPSGPQALSLFALTPSTAPRATIAHVSRVAAAIMSNGASQRLATLNLQQKAALCALISHQTAMRRSTSSIFDTPSKIAMSPAPTVRKLYETYSNLCNRDNALHPLTLTEFADVLNGLETLGLIGEDKKGLSFGVKAGTQGRKTKAISMSMGMGSSARGDKKLVCFVNEKEVRGSLDGVGGSILRGLLSDDV